MLLNVTASRHQQVAALLAGAVASQAGNAPQIAAHPAFLQGIQAVSYVLSGYSRLPAWVGTNNFGGRIVRGNCGMREGGVSVIDEFLGGAGRTLPLTSDTSWCLTVYADEVAGIRAFAREMMRLPDIAQAMMSRQIDDLAEACRSGDIGPVDAAELWQGFKIATSSTGMFPVWTNQGGPPPFLPEWLPLPPGFFPAPQPGPIPPQAIPPAGDVEGEGLSMGAKVALGAVGVLGVGWLLLRK